MGVWRETSRPRTDGTPADGVWLSDCTSALFPWKTKNKCSRFALARIIVKYGCCYITGQSGMPVHSSTIASREQDAPPPNNHQKVVVCLVHTAVMYTGKNVCRYLYIAECLPSTLRKAHGSRLRFRATMEAGSRKPAHPLARKDAVLIRSMLS